MTIKREVENHFEVILDEVPEQPPETIAELIVLVQQAQHGG